MECQALRCRPPYFMRRFFLIALTAGLLSPTAAKAESIWLVIGASTRDSTSMEKIQMGSLAQCKEQGEVFKAAQFKQVVKAVCLTGK